MKSFIPSVLFFIAASTSPVFAQSTPAGDVMAKDDHMMAAGDHMMPAMSKAEMAKLTKCKKMTPEKAAKNVTCAKLMATHSDSHM